MTDAAATVVEQVQEEAREIVRVLLKELPPDTSMQEVWTEALSLYRVRFEAEVLPPSDKPPRQRG